MLPFPIKPMLLQVAEEPFDSANYLFEWKVDGVRCLLHMSQGKIRLQSKTGKECTHAFPEFLKPSLTAKDIVLDGEAVVLTNGKPDFEAAMERYLSGPRKIAQLQTTKPAYYMVWDILWHNGRALLNLPLEERKEILSKVLHDTTSVRKLDFIREQGLALWQAIQDHGLEGMVAKRLDGKYLLGERSKNWLKIKNWQQEVVNVFGYKPKDGFVLVGTSTSIQGHARGMNHTEKAAFRNLLNELGTPDKDTIWLPSGIKGIVKFTNLTPKGNMRDCTWVKFDV